MELLVFSTLQWRMNPVTPISFFDHITRRLGLRTHLHWEFLHGCEQLLLILIADPDSKFMLYVPSILAAATMYGIANDRKGGKHKHGSMSSGPNSVTDASFSCGDSGDLWTATSSRQLLFKRSRSKDQQMRLPSVNHMFVDVLSSPR
ncbi:hypothetical protein V6N11_031827 [Hibiscus sabdariffa]|uniref:Cyclin C-terminal domain-containing protein n=1 Tax=Hibiscus sabdariffa TaxID=183260 RepID=A0ABR2SYT7_9ROSI